MKLIRNRFGISKLLLIVLLLAVFVLGAILSYVWTMSYYAPLEFQLPGNGTLTIERVQFSLQDAYRFNVTILNPSFSPSGVSITRLAVLTADEVIHDLLEVSPSIPYTLAVGKSQTFDCNWNWWQYTGQAINILAWVGDGSGATLQVETPFVGFIISELAFNSSLSVHRFNVTVQNQESSATHVAIASIFLNSTLIHPDNITQQLPYTLKRGDAVKFTCLFNWTNYQGQSVTVVVTTLERYEAERSVMTSLPVVLSITEVV